MPDKKCPRCGLWSTDSALLCDCGYDFKNATGGKSDENLDLDRSAGLIGIVTLIASITVFIASLFFPAFNLSDGGSYDGLTTFLIGWLGLVNIGGTIAYLAWCANIFLVLAWLGLVLSERRSAIVRNLALTIFGLALASIAVLLETLPVSGRVAEVTSMGLGFYLWLSSIVVCLVGYLAIIARAKFISNKAITNQ